MTIGRVPNANIAQILELLEPYLRAKYCFITVIDSSPKVVHSVGEHLISEGYRVRLVRGGIEILVSDLLGLSGRDAILNEFDEMYLINNPVSIDASNFVRFPGEHLFESLPREKWKILAGQMKRLGALAFLSDGVGVNCAFVDERLVQTIASSGFDFQLS